MHFVDLMQPMFVNGTCPGKSWKRWCLSPWKPWNLVFASPGKSRKKHFNVCTNPVMDCSWFEVYTKSYKWAMHACLSVAKRQLENYVKIWRKCGARTVHLAILKWLLNSTRQEPYYLLHAAVHVGMEENHLPLPSSIQCSVLSEHDTTRDISYFL